METATNLQACGQCLVFACCEKIGRVVFHGGAACELQVFLELANDARLLGPVALGLRGRRRHDPGPLVVGLHQALGLGQSLFGIAAQQAGIGPPLQNMHQFPAQVEGVLHRHVHALPGLGRMGVASIPRSEDAWVAVFALWYIVKFVRDAVTDVIDGPPDHLLHVERIRLDDPVGRSNHVFLRELAMGGFFVGAEFVQFDIHAEHVAPLARQDQHVALAGRRDQAFLAYIRKIRVGQDVHHTPGLVGSIAMQLPTDGLAHSGMRAITPHHVIGTHGTRGAPVHAGGILQGHRDRMILGGRVDRQTDDFPAVIRLQSRGGVLHDFQKQLMQARLVDQDVGHFRAVIGHVLHPSNPLDVLGVLGIRHPEGGLIDPVSFALDLVGKAKGLEHFHGARVDAVGFALDDVGGHALDDHRLDFGKLRQLRGQTQTRRPGASNQHIHFLGQGFIDAAVASVRRGFLDIGIATSESIFIELHHTSPKVEKHRSFGTQEIITVLII